MHEKIDFTIWLRDKNNFLDFFKHNLILDYTVALKKKKNYLNFCIFDFTLCKPVQINDYKLIFHKVFSLF